MKLISIWNRFLYAIFSVTYVQISLKTKNLKGGEAHQVWICSDAHNMGATWALCRYYSAFCHTENIWESHVLPNSHNITILQIVIPKNMTGSLPALGQWNAMEQLQRTMEVAWNWSPSSYIHMVKLAQCFWAQQGLGPITQSTTILFPVNTSAQYHLTYESFWQRF